MGSVNACVDLKREGDVAIITIENPPVNALRHEVRAGLIAALKQAEDPAIKAVVITGAGRAFSAGADHGCARERPRLDRGRHVGHARRFPLGKKHVALRFGFIAHHQLAEERLLAREALVEGELECIAHGFDARGLCAPAARASDDLRGRLVVGCRIAAGSSDLVLAGPYPPSRNN